MEIDNQIHRPALVISIVLTWAIQIKKPNQSKSNTHIFEWHKIRLNFMLCINTKSNIPLKQIPKLTHSSKYSNQIENIVDKIAICPFITFKWIPWRCVYAYAVRTCCLFQWIFHFELNDNSTLLFVKRKRTWTFYHNIITIRPHRYI